MLVKPINGIEQPQDPDKLIPEREAAEFLGVTVRTMQSYRQRGGGPKFVRLSARAVRYRRRDLIAYCDARLVRSTSDPGVQATA